MRITAGKFKGRRLETPKGRDLRPTSDKVRAAIFNALQSRGLIIDSVVIDAFCGTGALGLEALSQGASHCIFFDKAKSSIDLCKKNIGNLGCEETTQIVVSDATRVKRNEGQKADLIFLDPPYHQNLITPAIESLFLQGWISNEAFFIIECDKKEEIESTLITIKSEKIYGDTKVTFGVLKNTAINQDQ